MRVALVHDYLRDYGGAERVLAVLAEMYPEAPIYTAFCVKGSSAWQQFRNRTIVESFASKIPFFATKLHSPLRFLAPQIWRSFDFSGFDVVISSSSWFMTKGIRVPEGVVHVSYVHTPPRNLYGYSTGYWHQRWGAVRMYAAVVNSFLRQFDYETAQDVDVVVANSEEVKKRIAKFWRREAQVVYPPVTIKGVEERSKKKEEGKYFLTGGRLVGPKHFDVAIEAANKLNVPLKIFGVGPEEERLKKMAGPTVAFLGVVSEEVLAELYAGATAFLALADDEDFGITPVEAMMCGTPVLAYRGGGYRETVVDGETGVMVDKLTVEAVLAGIKQLKTQRSKLKAEEIAKWAQRFSKKRFIQEMNEIVASAWEKKRA